MDRRQEEDEGEQFDEFDEDEDEDDEYYEDDADVQDENLYYTYEMTQQESSGGDVVPEQPHAAPSAADQMRRSTSAAGRRSLRSSRASSRRSRMERMGRWTANAWNGTKSWFLGPLFIGIALGVGISLGRATFLVTMQRTTSLLLGPGGSARFGIAAR